MNHNAVGAGMLVALLLLFAAATGGAVADVQDEEDPQANGTFGAEVSSFMQASTAEAETEVEEGMFQAGMRRAETDEERRQLIERRQARLAARNARLQEQQDELSGDQPVAKQRAIASRVEMGAQGIERSVETTQEHAARAGLDTSRLNELRESASQLRGEVSELARDLAGNDRNGDNRSSDRRNDPPGADRGGGEGNGTNRTVGVSDGEFDDSDGSNESDDSNESDESST